MGIRGSISRNTLSNANKVRDWRLYADFAQALIKMARPLYAKEDLGLDLDNTIYALDASTLDLCLSVFPWAHFHSTKTTVKLHTLLDLRGNIPSFIHISDGKLQPSICLCQSQWRSTSWIEGIWISDDSSP